VGFCECEDLPSLSGLQGGQEVHQEMRMNFMAFEDEVVPATGQEPFSTRRCLTSLKTLLLCYTSVACACRFLSGLREDKILHSAFIVGSLNTVKGVSFHLKNQVYGLAA
jgi:hypothetical protein